MIFSLSLKPIKSRALIVMQQSQDGVKKDIIKHPLRDIEVTYEAGKTTLTPQDEELLSAYISLHDMQWHRKSIAHELYHESVKVNKDLKSLDPELKKAKASYDTSCALADKLSAPNYELKETSLQKLAQARWETEELIRDYNKKLLAVYEYARVMQEKLNEAIENDEEKVNAMFDKVAKLAMVHITNWENNSINAVAFDKQFNDFREFSGLLESHRETLLDECDEAMTNYTNLNLESTNLFNVWKEFIKRCGLLTAMYNVHNDAVGFTNN